MNIKNWTCPNVRAILIMSWGIFASILLVGQPRADYFFISLFLLIYFGQMNFDGIRFKIYKNLVIFQFSVFIILSSTLVIQTLFTILDYDKGMKRFANGYNVSRLGKEMYYSEVNYRKPILIDAIRQTKLYFDYPYIDKFYFHKCREKFNDDNCLYNLNVNSILLHQSIMYKYDLDYKMIGLARLKKYLLWL